ncbi:hypothetical protein [Streptomyces globisporus]|uniref:hypothetical protein n=1 Tax=Streptomyces globisporus TaxID=1908 RepID=UPI0036F98946|nr:hypothetical protein OG449_11765 [Streptomyces globisporus]
MSSQPGEPRATAGAAPASMRLNEAPADPSPPPVYGPFAPGQAPGLVSSPAQKRAAANAIEQHLEPDTKKSGNWASEENAAAVTALGAKDGEGWITSRAVKDAHAAWGKQVRNLMNRLGREKSSLREANTIFRGTELQTQQLLGPPLPPSPFNGY